MMKEVILVWKCTSPHTEGWCCACFYHTRQFVGSYMGMGISQNVGIGSMLAEDIQYLVHTAAFLAAGIQLSIAVGTCSTLPKQ